MSIAIDAGSLGASRAAGEVTGTLWGGLVGRASGAFTPGQPATIQECELYANPDLPKA